MKRLALVAALLLTIISCTEIDNRVIIPTHSLVYDLIFENKKCINWTSTAREDINYSGFGGTEVSYWGKVIKTVDCHRVNSDGSVNKGQFVLIEIEDTGLVWVAPDRTLKPDGFLD
jgi:hypothetical protein